MLGLNQSHLWGSYLRINNPAWSLDVELQYNLVVPFVVLLWSRGWAACSIILMFGAITSAYFLQFPTGLVDVDRSLVAWSIAFIAGFLLFKSHSLQRFFERPSSILSGAPFTAIYFLVTRESELRTVCATAVCLCLAGHLLVLPRDRRFGSLDHLAGELSYPVYIFHILFLGPILAAADAAAATLSARGHVTFLPLLVTNIVVTTAVGYAAQKILSGPIERVRAKPKSSSERQAALADFA